MKRRVSWVLGVGMGLYAALCGAVYWGQTGLLLFPTREVRLTPKDLGLPYEDVRLVTGDGERIAAWAAPPRTRDLWVLHCHGNGGNLSARLGTWQLLAAQGAGLLFFDYRGYGQSTGGARCEADLLADAEAAWQWLLARGVRPEQIVLFGESLGGGVAAALAERHPPRALILQSTFTSVTDRASELYWFLPVRWLSRYRLDTLSRLPGIRCPTLIMHSPEDEVIAYSHGRKLLAAATEPKTWVELSGGHNDPQPALGPAVREFLGSL